jgi:biotin operon repressor
MRNNPLLKTVMATIAEQTNGSKAYISEANLAQEISISRTRLRETLQTLNAYGIIEKRQKLGVAIKQVTYESVKETYELRELLEGHAIKSALDHVQLKISLNSITLNRRLSWLRRPVIGKWQHNMI